MKLLLQFLLVNAFLFLYTDRYFCIDGKGDKVKKHHGRAVSMCVPLYKLYSIVKM
jgi:hypothetical protein